MGIKKGFKAVIKWVEDNPEMAAAIVAVTTAVVLNKDDRKVATIESLIAGTPAFILYGKNRKNGKHDHRGNRGGDRTRAQKRGDMSKRK